MAERHFLDAVNASLGALESKDYRKALFLVEKARTSFDIDYDCNDEVMNAAARLGEINCEALSMLNQHDEAIQQGIATVKQYPKRWEGPLTLARAFQRARMLDEARRWCGKAYTLNPKTSTIRLTMMAIETDIKIEQSNVAAARSGSLGATSSTGGGNTFTATPSSPIALSNSAESSSQGAKTPRGTTSIGGLSSSTSGSGLSSVSVSAASSSTLVVPPIARAVPRLPSPLTPSDTVVTDVVKTAVAHTVKRPQFADENELPPLLPPSVDVSVALSGVVTVFGGVQLFYSAYSHHEKKAFLNIPCDVYAAAVLATAFVLAILRCYTVIDRIVTKNRRLNNQQKALEASDAKTAAAVGEIMATVNTPRSGSGKVSIKAQQSMNIGTAIIPK